MINSKVKKMKPVILPVTIGSTNAVFLVGSGVSAVKTQAAQIIKNFRQFDQINVSQHSELRSFLANLIPIRGRKWGTVLNGGGQLPEADFTVVPKSLENDFS